MAGWMKVGFYCYTDDSAQELWNKIQNAISVSAVHSPFIGRETDENEHRGCSDSLQERMFGSDTREWIDFFEGPGRSGWYVCADGQRSIAVRSS